VLSVFGRVFALGSLVTVAACVQVSAGPSGPSSDFIVVSDFAVPEGSVRLDPTMGFSLYRGEAGVPKQQRATSVGRAVSFLVTDTVVDQLRARGYDTVSTSNPNPSDTGHRALIISGTLTTVDEGQRRRAGDEHSAVIGQVNIRAELPGGGVQHVQSFAVDSRTAPPASANSGATSRETGVDADATRVGAEIARIVAEIARRNNWVPVR
jgi:hypothetical protein